MQNMASQSPVDPAKFYEQFLAEREEILKHKWIESSKAQEDIGFERALTGWISDHRSEWRDGLVGEN
jgi:hypothetical protein